MKIIKKLSSKDNRVFKYIQKTQNNQKIETGLYLFEENVLCISCQTSCPMNCIFCASSTKSQKVKTYRNLSSDEIINQIDNVLNNLPPKRKKLPLLFSFMGMGEPFLNYENLIETIKFLANKYPKSRITISTLGIRPDLIKDLASQNFKIPVKLHLSLHSPTDQSREKILPSSILIKESLDALEYYSKKTKTISKVNYTLIRELNDSKEDAENLVKLLRPYSFILKISRLNPFKSLMPPYPETYNSFIQTLINKKVKFELFFSDGVDIAAGCGQLGTKINNCKIS